MEPLLLNTKFEVTRLLDYYDEVVWAERFFDHGDFEMTFRSENVLPSDFVKGHYIQLPESDELMVIENIDINSDVEEGRVLKISGRALTKILEQRVITALKVVNGDAVAACLSILTEHFISPSDVSRKFDNFRYITPSLNRSHDNVRQTLEKIKVYVGLREFMTPVGLGFRITLGTSNRFDFQIQDGVDRSYRQSANPYLVFSPEYDNIDNTNFFQSNAEYANVAVIPYKDAADADKFKTTFRGGSEKTGIDRYEIIAELDSQESGSVPTNADFDVASKKAYSENNIKLAYDGEASVATGFEYGKHYNLGDIIQVEDPTTFVGPARIVEYIRSNGGEGVKEYPTFDYIDNTD